MALTTEREKKICEKYRAYDETEKELKNELLYMDLQIYRTRTHKI